ncbi:hypothetical protein M407DRAFT_244817 [Tulasnella calospora MUT 4182]|uniref:Uncharacterized protein n=1 Tax=Tulasnella calospora MUT 4182 TaxID=1051891 RepID=A0A0C3QEE4_9AGAM|nr:hypothetical protein M407DRAFT_244817 [Tulasnella calospora MUT 4182]
MAALPVDRALIKTWLWTLTLAVNLPEPPISSRIYSSPVQMKPLPATETANLWYVVQVR